MITILLALSLSSPDAVHDRAFWKSIVDSGFKVPASEDPGALVRELSTYLGSPDRELRDEYAYTIPERWIYEDGRLSGADLKGLLALWSGNLKKGIGERGTDSVLLRSFSALDLSLLAALDLKRPFLAEGDYESLLGDALAYLGQEKDVRGYEERVGWVHSAAHTGDLLKFLARNSKLHAADQSRIIRAIREKLAGSDLFIHGEDQRLAAALFSLVGRKDFDPKELSSWIADLKASEQALWDAPVFDHGRFLAIENQKNCLRGLAVLVAGGKGLGSAAQELEKGLLEVGSS